MGDQPALAIDHEGVAVLADLELLHDAPERDELKVDLGHGDAAARAVRHRHGQIGFGFLAEIDRPEPHPMGHRLNEGRLLRQVSTGADHVHGDARHLKLLAAVAVELDDFGDGWDQTLQARIVEAPLLDWQRRPLRLRYPADLPLDLAHEQLDFLSGRLGFLVLDLDRGAAILLIGEPQPERGIDHQHSGDQADKQHDVLEEQATLHSITSQLNCPAWREHSTEDGQSPNGPWPRRRYGLVAG